MTRNDKSDEPNDDPISAVGRGINTLLTALGETIAEVTDRLDDGQAGEIRRSLEIDTGKGPGRAEAGVRIRFADTGPQSSAPRAAMTRPVNRGSTASRAQAAPEPSRPIDFEILKDSSSWRLSADIPGVDEDDLKLEENDGEILIATTGTRKFEGSAPLPEGISVDDLTVSLRNGILELSCAWTKGTAG